MVLPPCHFHAWRVALALALELVCVHWIIVPACMPMVVGARSSGVPLVPATGTSTSTVVESCDAGSFSAQNLSGLAIQHAHEHTTNTTARQSQSVNQNGATCTSGVHTPKAVTYHEPTVM